MEDLRYKDGIFSPGAKLLILLEVEIKLAPSLTTFMKRMLNTFWELTSNIAGTKQSMLPRPFEKYFIVTDVAIIPK